jgi:hypothetical protein
MIALLHLFIFERCTDTSDLAAPKKQQQQQKGKLTFF